MRELRTNQKNLLANYNTAANTLSNQNNYYFNNKDDRNSEVNYDTSLLTHNTGRDVNQSPFCEVRMKRGP